MAHRAMSGPSRTAFLGAREAHTDPPADSVQAEVLADYLVAEMDSAWQAGRQPLAEEFLAGHPELSAHPRAAMRLICEEICLRREVGLELATQEVVRRFPQWQSELKVLFDCYRFLEPGGAAPTFPEVGEMLGDFRLLAELGRGARGRVFLACQSSLADRPLVLKLTPAGAQESQTLARLQHTHIVPLYSVLEFPSHHVQAICMPYLGGATLAELLKHLQALPALRTGHDLLHALDQACVAATVSSPAGGPFRKVLDRASYVEAICWIGACLADALQYAHERGLIHLDLKPSNVLLAADGQPMLLDFHLAREPIHPDGPAPPDWLGGTPEYMSPEQAAALAAVSAHRPIRLAVDGRSDIYSLGMLLYRALAGDSPTHGETPAVRLDRRNAQVTPGLAALVEKCLAPDPSCRYPDAAAVAEDLRRHLNDLPLRGVVNRSLTERWRKWRRRRPALLAVTGMLLVTLAVVLITSLTWRAKVHAYESERHREVATAVQAALREGEDQRQRHQHGEAVRTLTRGLQLARILPDSHDLNEALGAQLRLARCAAQAQRLHGHVERMRYLSSVDHLSPEQAKGIAASSRGFWNARDRVLELRDAGLNAELGRRLQTDLLDLALLWPDSELRLAPAGQAAAVRREALQVLAEAEALFGPSHILYRARKFQAEALGHTEMARDAERHAAEAAPQTAWEHFVLGRAHLRSGDLELAAAAVERAVDLQPQEFWPNFYRGICAHRLQRHDEAVDAFGTCIALAPTCAECFYNRALAGDALHRTNWALRDYSRALELNPTMGAAALNRGILHFRARRYTEALTDFQSALGGGTSAATVHYNAALLHLEREDWEAARASIRSAHEHNLGAEDVRKLQQCLPGER